MRPYLIAVAAATAMFAAGGAAMPAIVGTALVPPAQQPAARGAPDDAHEWAPPIDEDPGDASVPLDAARSAGNGTVDRRQGFAGAGRPPGAAANARAQRYRASRLLGGWPVAEAAVPWQAQIFNPAAMARPGDDRPEWQRQHWCGGALIAEDWVLTAAHCIDPEKVDRGFKVRLGSQDLSSRDGHVYRIARIVRHSNYDANGRDPSRPPNMYADDIALVRIVPDGAARPRDPRRIRPIALNRAPIEEGLPVSVTGWGATGNAPDASASARVLRVDLRAMGTATCERRPQRAGKVHDKVFCAASPDRATCRGDSGGPVVPTYGEPVLAGLVSWGSRDCSSHDRPGVYTRIDRYVGWIEAALRLPEGEDRFP